MGVERDINDVVLLLTRRKPGDKPSRGERRAERRVQFDDKVIVWLRDRAGIAHHTTAWGLNVSAGGMRLVFGRSLAVGEQVGIGLRGSASPTPGRVVWVSSRPDGCVAGIAFR